MQRRILLTGKEAGERFRVNPEPSKCVVRAQSESKDQSMQTFLSLNLFKLKGATRKEKKFIYLRIELKYKHSDIFLLTMFRRYQDEREEILGSMTQ